MKKLFFLTVLLLCAVITPMAFAEDEMMPEPEVISAPMESSHDALMAFYELDTALRSMGGALDRYNNGDDINCGEFLAHNMLLENLPAFADATGIWKDLVAIYHNAGMHAHEAVKDVVLACDMDADGMLSSSELSTANWGWARQGINEALEVLRPALIVGEENSTSAPEMDMPEEVMEEMPMPADDGECIIPSMGAWPACANGEDAKPASTADCMVPESGPWPECAKTLPMPPSMQKTQPVIVDEAVMEEPAMDVEPDTPATGIAYSNDSLNVQLPAGWQAESETDTDLGMNMTILFNVEGAETFEDLDTVPENAPGALMLFQALPLEADTLDARISKDDSLNSVHEFEDSIIAQAAAANEDLENVVFERMSLPNDESASTIYGTMTVDGVMGYFFSGIFYDEATEQLYSFDTASTTPEKFAEVKAILSTLTTNKIVIDHSDDIIVIPQFAAQPQHRSLSLEGTLLGEYLK